MEGWKGGGFQSLTSQVKPTTRQPRAPYSSWFANMPVNSVILRILSNLSPSTLFIVAPCLLVISLLTTVHLYTFSKYHWSLSNYTSAAAKSTKWRPPPPIPYTIPFLGHAIAFLTPKPGEFWANLIRSHPRAAGAYTLLLGGNTTYILFSPSAVEALFKARGPARDGFNLQIAERGLGIDHNEGVKYFGVGEGPVLTIPGLRRFSNWRKFGMITCWKRRV